MRHLFQDDSKAAIAINVALVKASSGLARWEASEELLHFRVAKQLSQIILG
jgi:hypothetical protein